ncbi:hypothetical protein [Nonomuraea angiospora]|uniref:hypothetical protein n=1 Tax=Nonomuraea angiospora TaxID=46172 RepID=UPI0029B471B7|nr:hypothetical protein [Nonomuraea angiospora]MDX3106906.1 hypothetical protein [Nonomuraea angiospora]
MSPFLSPWILFIRTRYGGPNSSITNLYGAQLAWRADNDTHVTQIFETPLRTVLNHCRPTTGRSGTPTPEDKPSRPIPRTVIDPSDGWVADFDLSPHPDAWPEQWRRTPHQAISALVKLKIYILQEGAEWRR